MNCRVKRRMPRGILHPDEHAQFVGQFEISLRRNPKAEFHHVEAAAAGELEFLPPSRLARVRRGQRRRITPIEHAANLQRPAVEPQLRAEDLDAAKAHARVNPVAALAAHGDLQFIKVRLVGRPGARIGQRGRRLNPIFRKSRSQRQDWSNLPRRATGSGRRPTAWQPALCRKAECQAGFPTSARFPTASRLHFIAVGIRHDEQLHVLPQSAEMRRDDGQKPLRVVADLFVEPHAQLVRPAGGRFAHLFGNVEAERRPAAKMRAESFAVPPDFRLGGGGLEMQQHPLAGGQRKRARCSCDTSQRRWIGALVLVEAGRHLHRLPVVVLGAVALKQPIAVQGNTCGGRESLGVRN